MNRQANLIHNNLEVEEIPEGTHMVLIEEIKDNYMCLRLTPQTRIKTYSSSDGYAAKKLKAILRENGREFDDSITLNALSDLCQDYIGTPIYAVVYDKEPYNDVMDFVSIQRRLDPYPDLSVVGSS